MNLLKRTVLFTSLVIPNQLFAESYKIDPAHSSVNFEVRHLGLSTVTGKFSSFGGTFDLDATKPETATGEAWVDTKSIDTSNKQRDGHLTSPDFFDCAKYPKAVFKAKSVEKEGKDKFKLRGDLTMKDKTHEVVFDVTYLGMAKGPDGVRVGFDATTEIDRFAFGLNWNQLIEATPVVGKIVKVIIHAQAAPQKADTGKLPKIEQQSTATPKR